MVCLFLSNGYCHNFILPEFANHVLFFLFLFEKKIYLTFSTLSRSCPGGARDVIDDTVDVGHFGNDALANAAEDRVGDLRPLDRHGVDRSAPACPSGTEATTSSRLLCTGFVVHYDCQTVNIRCGGEEIVL